MSKFMSRRAMAKFASGEAIQQELLASADIRHCDNFPNPKGSEDRLMRVWFMTSNGYFLISVDSLREARLVVKTVTALTGLSEQGHTGVQWHLPDQGWVEWTGADGETIHEIADSDLVFARRAKLPRFAH
jgi:hypothetical protein